MIKPIIALLLLLLFSSVVRGEEIGTASFYGNGEPLNDNTAYGIPFNESLLECASFYYQYGEIIKVTNLENGKSVIVRVTDKGPNKRLNRLIDLTAFAFSQIADLKEGLIEVKIELIKVYNERK